MTLNRRRDENISVLARSGPMAGVIVVHAAIVYVLAMSMGVVDVPKFAQPVQAVFIPEQTEPQEPEKPLPKPEIEEVAIAASQAPPEIDFDEVLAPPAEIPMPAESSNAIAATEASGPPVTQGLKTNRRVEPTYPAASRRAGEKGTVLLRVLVDGSGRPKDVQVARTSGFSRLDEAAIDAVRRWRFQAAMNAGRPIETWTQVSITFRLTET